MTQAFFELYVDHAPKGGSIVYWGLRRDFCDAGPYSFQLQWAETIEGEFVDAGSPVVDMYYAVDVTQRVWAKSIESYYRVILTTSEGVYTSFAKQGNGTWNKRDWLIARDIMRKERLLMTKFTGWNGFLLKRKIWGEQCPVCTDWDTQEVGDGKCPTCFGTGKVGGYWPGYETWAYEIPATPKNREKTWVDDRTYIHEDQVLPQMRMSAYPHLGSYDVFVDGDSGRRYVLRKVSVAAEMRGIPLINNVEFKLAPFTDIIYDVPLYPVVVEPTVEVPVVVTESEEFLEVPDETPPIDVSDEEEEEEEEEEVVVETEVIIPVDPTLGIWYEQDQWWLGSTLGDEDTALYRTNDGQLNPYFLDSYTWVPVGHTGTISVAAGAESSIFDVTASVVGVSGSYRLSGTYGPTFAYLKI